MKKLSLAALAFAVPVLLSAQSAVDLYNLSQSDIRGTARFMSMGGAFTALGGDLSTLTQNPAGIGVYRRSEIGATLDISPRSISAQSPTSKMSTSSTPVSCNNFGYIGTANLSGAMTSLSWGASYNRAASFNRKFKGYNGDINTSLTNYVATYSTAMGYDPSEMDLSNTGRYNPFYDSNIDWLSILSYNAYMINPAGGRYNGLWQPGTSGNSYSEVHESGYVDEYSIDFGGNFNNTFMWGVGFGITDLQYHRTAYYDEQLDDAYISKGDNGMTTGTADFAMTNYRNISGTGFNLKVGLIFRPINEFRIGLAFHTPTWYTLTNTGYGEVDYAYSYSNGVSGNHNSSTVYDGNEYTDNAFYNFRLNTPWKIMAGAAFVLGSTAIVSADYEYQAYNKMRTSYQGQFGDYISDDYVNADVEEYYKGANILRVGVEFRVTSSFSVRAGYNYTSSTASNYMKDGGEVLTSGTDPSFTINGATNAVSFGLGYRYKAFYIDAAYVYRNKKSTYKPYTDYGQVVTPQYSLTDNTNSIVFSAGFKF